ASARWRRAGTWPAHPRRSGRSCKQRRRLAASWRAGRPPPSGSEGAVSEERLCCLKGPSQTKYPITRRTACQREAVIQRAQPSQRRRFDLADALTRDGEFIAELFQRVVPRLTDAEAHANDLLLPWRQRRKRLTDLRVQVRVHRLVHRLR